MNTVLNARRQRRSANVIRAMARELARQVREGTLISAAQVDLDGRAVVEGRVDLAMLAWVTEQALIAEFFPGVAVAPVEVAA